MRIKTAFPRVWLAGGLLVQEFQEHLGGNEEALGIILLLFVYLIFVELFLFKILFV